VATIGVRTYANQHAAMGWTSCPRTPNGQHDKRHGVETPRAPAPALLCAVARVGACTRARSQPHRWWQRFTLRCVL